MRTRSVEYVPSGLACITIKSEFVEGTPADQRIKLPFDGQLIAIMSSSLPHTNGVTDHSRSPWNDQAWVEISTSPTGSTWTGVLERESDGTITGSWPTNVNNSGFRQPSLITMSYKTCCVPWASNRFRIRDNNPLTTGTYLRFNATLNTNTNFAGFFEVVCVFRILDFPCVNED